jgi:site-specific DNA-methyltransferase (adenine-specific)
MIGATFSQAHYDLYKETGNKNLFEEVLDKLVMDEHLDLEQDVKDYIMSEDIREDKRIFILSNLLKEKSLEIVNSFTKLRDCETRTEHLNEALLTLNKYIEVGQQEVKKYGEVFTPLSLVKEMVATLPEEVWSNPNLKWLDPANGMGNFPLIVIYKLMKGLKTWEPDTDKRYKHIIENMIYVCELQPRNAFMYLSLVDPKDDLSVNLYCGSFLDEGFDNHMKQVWDIEKFDIVLGNPPYNQMIDMDFLCKSYDISNIVLYVHPSTWLLDQKGKQRKFINAKNIIGDDLVSIRLFNGNKIFGIALFVPCVITYINKSVKQGYIKCDDGINKVSLFYTDIRQINKFSNNLEFLSLKEKILKHSYYDNLLSYKNSYNGDYYINTAQIRGNVLKNHNDKMVQDDFYTIVTKDTKVENKKTKHMFFSFSSEQKAQNFLNYIKTNFCRFCLSIYKNNSQLDRGELDIIPWLDFTQEWTDEKLKDHFNITDKEWEFIESVIPDYY